MKMRMTKTLVALTVTCAAMLSAMAAVTIPSTISEMLDLQGETASVSGKSDSLFGNGGGIRNGTLTVSFNTGYWQLAGKTFTVGTGGHLGVTKSVSGDNVYGQTVFGNGGVARLVIDGGTVTNHTFRKDSLGHWVGFTKNASVHITNGGMFKSEKTYVRVDGNADNVTGTISIDQGTLNVADGAKEIRLGSRSNTTGILAVTNGTVTASAIYAYGPGTAKMTFVDSTLKVKTIARSNNPAAASYCVFDGCTLDSSVSAGGSTTDNLNTMPYRLEGKGLTIDAENDALTKGYYIAKATDRGKGPFIKKGTKKLTMYGCFNGQKFSGDASIDSNEGVTDFQVLGGEVNFAGDYLSIDKLNLTVRNGATISGKINDLTASFKSLTIDGTVSIPMSLDDAGCAELIKAETLTLDTTSAAPVKLVCSGTPVAGVEYVVRKNLTAEEATKFAIDANSTTPVDLKLVYRDGNLFVETDLREGAVTWQGAAGDSWWGTGKWLYGGRFTTFQSGDLALFNGTEGAARVVVDADATLAGLIVSNDVEIVGAATLATPSIEVAANKTLTVSAPLGEPVVKNGAGSLTLQDYANAQSVTVNAGEVKLVWTGTPTANPFPTAKDANAVAGVLDLGGASQDIVATDNAKPPAGGNFFRNGGEIRNGTVTVDFGNGGWWYQKGVVFTVGPNAVLQTKDNQTDANGEMTFCEGATIIVDRGTFNNRNNRSGNGNNLGSGAGTGTVRVQNGGTFNSSYRLLRVGWNGGSSGGSGTGLLSSGGLSPSGTLNAINIGSAVGGGAELSVGGKINTVGTVALTNCLLTASALHLGEAGGGKAEITLKDSTLVADRIYKSSEPAAGSFVKFDGCTMLTSSATPLEDLGFPYELEGAGLTVSNANAMTLAAPMTGTGGLVKKGAGKLTLGGTPAFTGGLTVEDGDLALVGAVGGGVLTVPDGTTITVTLASDGFASRNLRLQLDPNTSGKVRIVLDGAVAAGTCHTLFEAGSATVETFARIETEEGVRLRLGEGGRILVTSDDAFIWTGDATGDGWSLVDNWGCDRVPGLGDGIAFVGGGAHTTYDLANGLTFTNLAVNSGTYAIDVGNAAFVQTPVTVAAGAALVLSNATGRVHPFSTAQDANAVAGVLDLGGASQTVVTTDNGISPDDGGLNFFRNGGELRNGTVTVDFGDGGWWYMKGVAFTVGTNAVLQTKDKATDANGELTLQNGAKLVVDGGTFRNRNYRGSGDNASVNHIGGAGAGNGTGMARVINGGVFESQYLPLRVGWGCVGILSIDGGTLNVGGTVAGGSLGKQELRVGCQSGSHGIVAVTNGSVYAKNVVLAENSGGRAELVFKDSTLVSERIYKGSAPAEGSSVTFDGCTMRSSSPMPLDDLGFAYLLEGAGLTLADGSAVTLACGLKGDGPLVKTGRSDLALTGDLSDYSGDISVDGGTLTLASAPADGTLTVADGMTISVTLTEDGFTTRNLTLALDPNTSGKVKIDAWGALAEGTSYTLFRQGALTDTQLARLESDGNFTFNIEDGSVKLVALRQAFVWTGGATEGRWSRTENWEDLLVPLRKTCAVFGNGENHTTYDLRDGELFMNVIVNGGRTAIDIAGASFANTPVTVAAGAELVLENAAGRTNVFSTATDANTVSGVLDFGGATQDFVFDAKGFGSGAELRNGVVNLSFATYWLVHDLITFGPGTRVVTSEANTAAGQLIVNRGGRLVIDGGQFLEQNHRGSDYGTYLGSDAAQDGTLCILNGGTFASKYAFLRVGYNSGATGILAVTNGTVNIADGGQNLRVAANGTTGIVAFSNATLKASNVRLCESSSGVAQLTFKDSTLTLNAIGCDKKAKAGSFLLFDGTTIRALSSAVTLSNVGTDYRLVGNGLTFSCNSRAVTVAGTLAGDGSFVKQGSGTLTVTGEASGYTGTVDVQVGTFVSSESFGGGLTAAAGATLDVGGATFAGDVTLPSGVIFAGVRPHREQPECQTTPLVLLRTTGVLDVHELLEEKYDTTRNRFYVVKEGDTSILYYGARVGATILVK